MKTIKNFIAEEKRYVDLNAFNFTLLLDYCNKYSFVKGEKSGIGCTGSMSDLYSLVDHLYLFVNSDGTKSYVSNTYLPLSKIWETILKYNLVSFVKIMGPGFWHPKSIAIMFDYYKIEDMRKHIRKDPFYIKYHVTNIADFEGLMNDLKSLHDTKTKEND